MFGMGRTVRPLHHSRYPTSIEKGRLARIRIAGSPSFGNRRLHGYGSPAAGDGDGPSDGDRSPGRPAGIHQGAAFAVPTLLIVGGVVSDCACGQVGGVLTRRFIADMPDHHPIGQQPVNA